jgi:uncharacterized protein (TIGR03790 family)
MIKTAWLGVAGLALTSAVSAQLLQPREVVVVANRNSVESMRLAKYYQEGRKLPPENVIALDIPMRETLEERVYRKQVVPALRQALLQQNLAQSTRCLVTMYDVPIRIAAQLPDEIEKIEINTLQMERTATTAKIKAIIEELRAMAPALPDPNATTTTAPKPAPTTPGEEARKLANDAMLALQNASKRIAMEPEDSRMGLMLQLVKADVRLRGAAGRILSQPPQPKNTVLQQQLADIAKVRQEFEVLAKDRENAANREKMRQIQLMNFGFVAYLLQIEEDLIFVKRVDSEAAFDSELTLLWEDHYPRTRWALNPANLEMRVQTAKAPQLPRQLMVSRLDAPNPEIVMNLIDTGLLIEHEGKGLDGVAYFDARGLPAQDAYGKFDQDLRDTAKYLKTYTDLQVELEDTPELLKLKDAPNAVLYCGWYSVRNFQETAAFKAGSVGYHVASFEMMSLHNQMEKGWVPNLLKRHVAATLGSVEEPYLSAFPKPSLFFPLLVSGEFTNAEIYQMTIPLLSWRMAFVGDPLYRPFKGAGKIKVETLKEHPVLKRAFDTWPPEGVLITPLPAVTTSGPATTRP